MRERHLKQCIIKGVKRQKFQQQKTQNHGTLEEKAPHGLENYGPRAYCYNFKTNKTLFRNVWTLFGVQW